MNCSTRKILLSSLVVITMSVGSQGATIYSEGFESTGNGGDDVDGTNPTGFSVNPDSNMPVVVTAANSHTGSQSLVFDRNDQDRDQVTSSRIERSFSLTPQTNQNITISMWIRQSTVVYEGFNNSFSVGAGVEGLLFSTYSFTDYGALPGGTFNLNSGPLTEGSGAFGNGTGNYVQYFFSLPTSETLDKTVLNLRVDIASWGDNDSSLDEEFEDYWIDDILITGVPEPSAALLTMAGLIGLVSTRRRRR